MPKTFKRWLLLATLGASACTNPQTPAGFEGYVYHVPLIFGSSEYRSTLVGPSSTGLSWRLYVENVDMRAKSQSEKFSLLTSDNLSVAFEVNTRLRVRPGGSKEIVEEWGTDWYERNVREPLRTVVRQEITQVSATDIQLRTDEVRARIFDASVELYAKTPIELLSVDIGNIQFPKEVTQAIERKIATEQELQRQEFLRAKTRKEAGIKVLEALKVAKQQEIISSTLDPIYVQRMAVQSYRALAASSNKTVMVLPNTANGTGLPQVLSAGESRELSAEDRALLEEMEKRYMKMASEAIEGGDVELPEPAPAKPVVPTAEPEAPQPEPEAPEPEPESPPAE
ncbi:MAG: SPFH domain-containing protein [Nannocystaceae bacterium]|nr:SPFH domain-containing protein [bacterium]